ncbi:MAG: DUF2489 domain-containing protein [Pseudomonadales bacterium]
MVYSTAALLSGLGLLILIALALYACKLKYQLTKQDHSQSEFLRAAAEQQASTRHSLFIIASAAKDSQVGIVEASIRISTLLDAINPDARYEPDYQVIYDITERTSHIPRLEAWHNLDKSSKRKHEKDMRKLEQTLRAKALIAFAKVKNNS